MATITKIFRGEHKGAENVPLVSYRLDGDKKDRIAKIIPKFKDSQGVVHELQGETYGDYRIQAEALVEHYSLLSKNVKEHERTMPIHDKLERRDKGRAANEHGQKLQTIRELFKELSVKDKEKLLSEWTIELEKDKDFEQGVSQLQSVIDDQDNEFEQGISQLQSDMTGTPLL